MKRTLLVFPILLWGCVTSSNPGGYNGEVLTPGTYQAFFNQKWYADDVTPRPFRDVTAYQANGKSNGSLDAIDARDTVLICEGDFEWRQQEGNILFWNRSQRCKDIENLAGPFGAWDFTPDTVSRPIRNLTSNSFETEAEEPDGAKFWVHYTLIN